MGLGSCRILLEGTEFISDFDVRDIIGEELPMYANIGIVQLEQMIRDKSSERLSLLVEMLKADGLIIHVNPLQEWLQNEGDFLHIPPAETIEEFLSNSSMKVIVKEVGQGMGPESIMRLMKLPIEAFELAAYGGTNFARIEMMRADPETMELYGPLARIGHSADEMICMINDIVTKTPEIKCRQIIVSGGIRSFLDGHYYISKSLLPAIFGQASNFLRYASEDYNDLRNFVSSQVKGLQFARAFLKPKTGS
ncbi:MAG: isopentenyl-diphosphate delta-isomerase [Bacteroidota bacterium]